MTITSTPSVPRVCHLGDGGDAAVDGEHERHAVRGEPVDRVGGEPVALLEPARQVPRRVDAELAQRQHGERGGRDAVDVVVAVHAHALAALGGGAQALDGGRHVAEQQRVVAGLLALEERSGRRRVGVAAAREDARGDLAHAELAGEGARLAGSARAYRPAAIEHRRSRLRP